MIAYLVSSAIIIAFAQAMRVARQRARERSEFLRITVASIGEYTGLELIARGGMGEIYKANHPTLNRTLAIKVLSAHFKEDPDFNKRFAREAEMMALCPLVS